MRWTGWPRERLFAIDFPNPLARLRARAAVRAEPGLSERRRHGLLRGRHGDLQGGAPISGEALWLPPRGVRELRPQRRHHDGRAP